MLEVEGQRIRERCLLDRAAPGDAITCVDCAPPATLPRVFSIILPLSTSSLLSYPPSLLCLSGLSSHPNVTSASLGEFEKPYCVVGGMGSLGLESYTII